MVEPSARWFDILGNLAAQPEDVASAQHAAQTVLKAVLSRAIQSVKDDEQWNVSGIPELLVRAREMADLGSHSAWRTAISLLDFHRMVERHRNQVTPRPCRDSPCADETVTSSSSSSSDVTSTPAMATVGLMPTLKRRHSDEGEASCCSDGLEFAWPKLPAMEGRFRVGAGWSSATPSQPSTPRPQQSSGGREQLAAFSSPSVPEPQVWSGPLCYAHGGGNVVLADIDMRLPVSLPLQPLFVSAMVPRASVKMGKHHTCRTSFHRSSPDQVSKLRALAVNELVAVMPLSASVHSSSGGKVNGGAGGSLVLVPYLDNAKALRCVSFLLNSAPAVVTPSSKRVAR